jgi:hypothetical protein
MSAKVLTPGQIAGFAPGKSGMIRTLIESHEALRAERDAAQARVRELEAEQAQHESGQDRPSVHQSTSGGPSSAGGVIASTSGPGTSLPAPLVSQSQAALVEALRSVIGAVGRIDAVLEGTYGVRGLLNDALDKIEGSE